MKVQSEVTNDKPSEYGFKLPVEGWHIVEFLEGIKQQVNEDGTPKEDKKGNKSWLFPAKISNDEDESNGIYLNQFITENDFGEHQIADFIAAVGQKENFEKAFPGDRSFFESAIMDKIKIKLPGQFCKMRTELETYEGKQRPKVKAVAGVKYVPKDDVKGKADKKVKKEAAASEPAKESGGGW